MQQTELLHTILSNAGAIKHKGRLNSVLNAVESVMSGANLDLTSLGRHMKKEIKPKSKIKEIDYLLSNGHLHKESRYIYKAVNEWFIGDDPLLFIRANGDGPGRSPLKNEQRIMSPLVIIKTLIFCKRHGFS